MLRKIIYVLVLLIILFVGNDLFSQIQIVNKDDNSYEQFKIHEGVVCNHRKVVKFSNKGKTEAKVTIGESIIVALADEPYKWGFFQFPSIYRTYDGTLLVRWAMREDSYKAYGKKNVGKNAMMSFDNGKTWIDYDGRYDLEKYSYAIKDDDEYMAIDIPNPKDISLISDFPNAIDEVDHYKIKYKFYKDSELPDELEGIYLLKWTTRNPNASQIKKYHAKFNDNGLYRYATDNQMSVLWSGDVKKLKNGIIIGSTYRGFYIDKNNKVLPSGISFYKLDEERIIWDLMGKIPFQPDLMADPTGNERKVWGFTEPTFEELENGTLVCVIRSSEEEKLTPMYKAVSIDGGQTWSKPRPFTPNGVKPHLLKLGNGTLVLSSGRPGVQIRFNFDGTAEKWTEPIDMLPFMKEDGSYTREVSCGYTGLLAVDDNTFYLVYSDFMEKNERGENRKAIKICKIKVKNYVRN